MQVELKDTKNYNEIVKIIRKNLKQYITSNNLKSLVLGISGGIDSTVCAALARPVCDELGIPLIGVTLPIDNKAEETELAEAVGLAFCTVFWNDNLKSTYEILKQNMSQRMTKLDESNKERKIRFGNIKARLRMIYLYDIAQHHKGMILSTDNLTEYLLGFWTLHGDVGDYGMIQNLWKTEVYGLARWLVENDLIDNGKYCNNYANKFDAIAASIEATPTDGLGITDSDMAQIKADNYYDVDKILQYMLKTENAQMCSEYLDISEDIIFNVWTRYLYTEYKRENPYNISRKLFIEGE